MTDDNDLVTETQFLELGLEKAGFSKPDRYKPHCAIERFSKVYGALPVVCQEMWKDLCMSNQVSFRYRLTKHDKKQPRNLLIGLRFLWKGEDFTDLGLFFGLKKASHVSKIAKRWAGKIQSLLILKTGRLEDHVNSPLMMPFSLDCTMCPMTEPRPFSTIWSAWKFGGKPGLNYEILLCIDKPKLAWVYGPLPPGRYNDLSTFRKKLKKKFHDLFQARESLQTRAILARENSSVCETLLIQRRSRSGKIEF
ncbi:hypothetical protein SEMRO_217_G089630.1 [Seminavis robusta]|uniref:DDE Tnp4 domain-containing protein n=1 Tax=Seminavis robusta TaxID=568900 RepID=A0A9N8DL30_9STRA|nr:hypothetical protein SEMRO_116_G057100.1 [Seminavis robusta]CAB9505037.1 hypothetical protein SEMRO_217_G089630.1 [Seminavis robusta]|eukprot:Sro116_g057100.1 n/a (251) ;mRNA; f:61693-62445